MKFNKGQGIGSATNWDQSTCWRELARNWCLRLTVLLPLALSSLFASANK